MKIKRVKPIKIFRGDQLPDIDIDFPADFRDAVKEYIKEKYGYEYTCSIGTYTRMKLRTCIKDFGKVKGLSFDYTNKLTKDIDDQIEYTWGDLIEYASKSKALFKFVQENPELVHLCKYALLQPKAESVHPSAVVIVPRHTVDGTDRPIDISVYMSQMQLLLNETTSPAVRKLIMQDIDKGERFIRNNVVDTEYYFMFKTKDVDLLQKRVRQMINGLATCGLNASLASNSDLRLILENFLNGGNTTEFGTVMPV